MRATELSANWILPYNHIQYLHARAVNEISKYYFTNFIIDCWQGVRRIFANQTTHQWLALALWTSIPIWGLLWITMILNGLHSLDNMESLLRCWKKPKKYHCGILWILSRNIVDSFNIYTICQKHRTRERGEGGGGDGAEREKLWNWCFCINN